MNVRGAAGTYLPAGVLSEGPVAARRGRNWGAELSAVLAVIVVAGLIEFMLRHMLTRPFYSDESWRAYDISLGIGFLHHLSISGAPLALGWMAIENAARVIFGDTEAGLRAPMFLALPALGVATYFLARRWLGIVVSFCAAALLVVNSWVVNNALQLKSYTYEGLFAVAAVALYLLIQRRTWSAPRLALLYAALGLTCVFALPNMFVVGPLLVLDLIRVIRARERVALRIGGQALAVGIAVAHYVAFVRPQARIAATAFWVMNYAPHKLGPLASFIVRGVGSYFPGMITGVVDVTNSTPTYQLPLPARVLLATVLAALLLAGIVVALRDSAGQALVVALLGAMVLELAGSAVQRWPFGLVRVNIFELPLLYILLGIGGVGLARALRGRRKAQSGPAAMAPWRALALGVAGIAVVAAGIAGGVATERALAQTSSLQTAAVDFSGLNAAVAKARKLAQPGDVAIITSHGDEWLYYMDSYAGYPNRIARHYAIPASSTLWATLTPSAVQPFLAAHRGTPAIFLMEFFMPDGTQSPPLYLRSLRMLSQLGYCQAREFFFFRTGELAELTRGACSN